MAARIGFGTVAPLRADVGEPSRYVAPRSLHPGALWIAAAAPLLAMCLLIGAR